LRKEIGGLFLIFFMLFFLTPAFAETNVSGTIDKNTTWTKAGSPYIVTGDITVASWASAVLTVEAGVEVRFEKGTGITVGYVSYGSLIAKGTEASPIRFTSNAVSPAPGDWAGIDFKSSTKEAIVEYCTVEYGGFDDMADIYIEGINATVQYSTIRYSKLAGIYITTGNPVIKCNTIEENHYGVYIKDVSTSLPAPVNNNFMKNAAYGIYNEDAKDTVTAANNWWNDTGGSDKGGDKIFGNVTTTPYLTAKSECTPLPEKTAYQQGYEAGRASSGICSTWDVDGDGKIGLAEAVYALQVVIGLKKR